MRKEAVVHMTIRGVDVAATFSYADKDEAEITELCIKGEGCALLRPGVFAEIEDRVFGDLPEMVATGYADPMDAVHAEIDRELEIGEAVVRMNDALLEATTEVAQ